MTTRPEDVAPFVGAWTLLSFELLPSEVVEKPLGDYPLSRILYLGNERRTQWRAGPSHDRSALARDSRVIQ